MHTCVLVVTDTSAAVIFLSQLMFIFPLFSGMVINAKEFETKEIQKLTEIKNQLQHIQGNTFLRQWDENPFTEKPQIKFDLRAGVFLRMAAV